MNTLSDAAVCQFNLNAICRTNKLLYHYAKMVNWLISQKPLGDRVISWKPEISGFKSGINPADRYAENICAVIFNLKLAKLY